jgi:hypothetical protein
VERSSAPSAREAELATDPELVDDGPPFRDTSVGDPEDRDPDLGERLPGPAASAESRWLKAF